MRIVILYPYLVEQQDLIASKFIYLLSAYLRSNKADLTVLLAEDFLETAMMDPAHRGRAHLTAQKQFLNWTSLPARSLADFITAQDLKQINQNHSDSDFLARTLKDQGLEILEQYCKKNELDKTSIAKCRRAALMQTLGTERFVNEIKPQLLITCTATDFLTSLSLTLAHTLFVKIASYQYQNSIEKLRLTTNKDTAPLDFDFYIHSIDHFRPDPQTWDDQLRSVVLQNVNFLGLQSNQLSLLL